MRTADVIDSGAVAAAIASRRSAGRLTDPCPTFQEVADLVATAVNVPDHGNLRPWRFIEIRGAARARLGKAMAAATANPQDAAKPQRAPLLLAIVLHERESPKVPRWEQLASVACAVSNLSVLLHANRWHSRWRTGALIDAPQLRECLELEPNETLLGFLYIGTGETGRGGPPVKTPSVHEVLRRLPADEMHDPGEGPA